MVTGQAPAGAMVRPAPGDAAQGGAGRWRENGAQRKKQMRLRDSILIDDRQSKGRHDPGFARISAAAFPKILGADGGCKNRISRDSKLVKVVIWSHSPLLHFSFRDRR
jgi:hypothetical protein